MFSAPYSVGVTRGDGSVVSTGQLEPGDYHAFFDGLTAQSGGWADLIQIRSDGTVLRALAPGHGVGRPARCRLHRWVADGVMSFTDGFGAVVATFDRPDADSIFGCHKQLDAPDDQVVGPIAPTLCAGYNRTTLLTNPNQPDSDPSGFYQDAVTNQYARLVHEQMVDGKAYAFAFDDVGNCESLVHDGDPQAASVTLDPFD